MGTTYVMQCVMIQMYDTIFYLPDNNRAAVCALRFLHGL